MTEFRMRPRADSPESAGTPRAAHPHTGRFFGIAFGVMTALFAYAAMVMPPVMFVAGAAVAAPVVVPTGSTLPAVSSTVVSNYQAACNGVGTSTDAVPICQQPLTMQPPIPPNIVLMLDDSGSMSWNFMPDWSFLENNDNNDAVIDATNNGVYYNPTVTYTPPPQANGTSYTSYTDMSDVPFDGLDSSPTDVNLFAYDGSLDKNECGGGVCSGSAIEYTTASNLDSFTYPRDYHDSHWGHDLTSWPGKNYDFKTQAGCDNWYADFDTNRAYKPWYAYKEVYDSHDETCTIYYASNPQPYFFQYSTGPADGPYVVHYIAPTTADCTSAPVPANCVGADDTSGTSAPAGVSVGQNIANWFAYYHTRITMAKTGLMTAFNNLNPDYRFGFGSIDGNNHSYITNNLSYTSKSSTYIANVAVFGDGSSGTQRANFWSWVLGESPNNSTPLRSALRGAGEYYQTSQPWTTMSSDPGYGTADQPSNIACRQAYTILTTDGFWNGDFSSSTIAGASDATGPKITGPNTEQYQYSPTQPFSGGAADSGPSLADVAMYYWENDLQSGIDNEVPTNSADPAFWQHMVTFTLGLGFTPSGITGTSPGGNNPPTTTDIFNWAQSGGGTTNADGTPNQNAISSFGWPTPSGSGGSGGSINNIADLEHAGVTGHGQFYSAKDPQSFVSGLEDALKRAASRLGSSASLAANSTQLNTGTVIYQSTYHTSVWTGDLQAFAVNQDTGAVDTSSHTWSASDTLVASATVTGNVKTYPDRNIMTYNPGAAAGSQFVAFKDDSSTGAPPALSSAELAALGSTTAGQAAMVDYLRGDSTLEESNGGSFRNRSTPLGDIIDSQPVYVGAPDGNAFVGETFTGTDTYSTFVSAHASRTPLLYVASNDGMLHAFNAATGAEVFAYLPAAVIEAGISNLANPDYGSDTDPHQDYNDGQLTVANAYFSEGSAAAAWHTVLVGTTGRGSARAVYALDVTDPSSIKFLWERSAGDGLSDSGYLGQMVGTPVIAQTSTDSTQGPTWSVLIGNGYNSAENQAALLQFDLATGTLYLHTAGTDTNNGLAAPVAWIGTAANGLSTDAYAGDLLGHVWNFQLNSLVCSGTPPVCATTATPSSDGTQEFTAEDGSGAAQPITAGLMAGKDPNSGNVWVFFGTGKYLQFDDLHNTQVQSWYGLIMQTGANNPPLPALPTTTGGGDLVQRFITAQTDASTSSLGARTITPTPSPSDMSGKRGWYLDLQAPDADGDYVAQGEMMVDANQFQAGLLLGTTRIPVVTDICNPSGSGWIMALDPFTGTAPDSDFFDVNGDGSINSGDELNGHPAAGVGFTSMPNPPIFVGGQMEVGLQNGNIVNDSTAGATGSFKRISWREVVNP
ncbi:MAG TPA: PilC/PilY family type IV pilus protein [Rhodanobacteraceae bacterium]|nr:PilC/PilY family type IV pilus protein [Rhodanobacteraceae bacterium]